MFKKKWRHIPFNLLLIKISGGILFSVGIIDLLLETSVLPEALQFNNHTIFLIISGVILLFPQRALHE